MSTTLVPVDSLSPEEIEAVLAMRAERAAKAARLAFRLKAVGVAHAFDVWSQETGEGLTVSTFVNTFGYDQDDCGAMYEAVKRIFEAAWPQ